MVNTPKGSNQSKINSFSTVYIGYVLFHTRHLPLKEIDKTHLHFVLIILFSFSASHWSLSLFSRFFELPLQTNIFCAIRKINNVIRIYRICMDALTSTFPNIY